MFENSVISYVLEGDTCIITYKHGALIDEDAANSIVAEKDRLLKSYTIRRFVGVIHSSVKIDKKTMVQFASKSAIAGVDAIAVVYLSKKIFVNKYYKIGAKILNLLVFVMLKSPEIKFFNDEKNAKKWSKNLNL